MAKIYRIILQYTLFLYSVNSFASSGDLALYERKLEISNDIVTHNNIVDSNIQTPSEYLQNIDPKYIEKSLVDLRINYRDYKYVSFILFNYQDNNILVPSNDLIDLGVRSDFIDDNSILIDGTQYVNISMLDDSKYQFDFPKLKLNIDIPVERMVKQHFDAYTEEDQNYKYKEIDAVSFNYDVNISNTKTDTNLASTYDLKYFSPSYGPFINSFFLSVA